MTNKQLIRKEVKRQLKKRGPFIPDWAVGLMVGGVLALCIILTVLSINIICG